MTFVDGPGFFHKQILVAFGKGKCRFDFLTQVILIVLENQSLLPTLLDDLCSNFRLGSYCINRHQTPFEASCCKSSGIAVISLDFSSVAS